MLGIVCDHFSGFQHDLSLITAKNFFINITRMFHQPKNSDKTLIIIIQHIFTKMILKRS